jgi:hypothetical protein
LIQKEFCNNHSFYLNQEKIIKKIKLKKKQFKINKKMNEKKIEENGAET